MQSKRVKNTLKYVVNKRWKRRRMSELSSLHRSSIAFNFSRKKYLIQKHFKYKLDLIVLIPRTRGYFLEIPKYRLHLFF